MELVHWFMALPQEVHVISYIVVAMFGLGVISATADGPDLPGLCMAVVWPLTLLSFALLAIAVGIGCAGYWVGLRIKQAMTPTTGSTKPPG